jgi:hypothetical protein
MKPLKCILLAAILFTITSLCNGQNIVTTKDLSKYKATSVYLTHNSVVFVNAKTKWETFKEKKTIKSVQFHNGLLITYSDFNLRSRIGNGYNSTINFVNGDFLTADIILITADSITYTTPASSDTLFITTKDVIEINYLNGVREHFTSNDSVFEKAEAAKPKVAPPHYQNSSAFYIGAGAGYINSWTNSNYNYLSYSAYDLKGFTPSVTAFYDFSHNGSLNMNLAFAPKGTGLKVDSSDMKFKLSYLELPLAYQFQFGNDHLKFFVETGFYFGYLLSAKFILNAPSKDEERKITSELKHLDFGMLLGGGTKYYLKNGYLFANFRYEFAFSSLGGYTYYSNGYNNYFDTGQLNNCYSISAGYVININHWKSLVKKK